MSEGFVNSAYISALVSFATLVRVGRMTIAVKELGISRQTISRHMDLLDEKLGGPVVRLSGQGDYDVTKIGEAILEGASDLVRQAQSMSIRKGLVSFYEGGLESVWLKTDESEFRGRQHPLWRVNVDAPELIQNGLKAWQVSNFDMRSEEMGSILPYALAFRRADKGWVCSHVGDQSEYSKWFGHEWAQSAVGRYQADTISGSDYARFCSVGYLDTLQLGTCRLDHHDIIKGTTGDGHFKDISYQRLSMTFVLADKTPTLVTLVVKTKNVDVPEFHLG